MHALLRLLMIVIGFAAAVLTAGFVTVYLEASNVVRPSGISESQFSDEIFKLALFVSAFAASLCIVPAFIFGLLAESFRWRAIVIYAVAGVLLGAFCLIDFFGIAATGNTPIFKDPTMTFPAAGLLGGIVYWFLTGRFSGFKRNDAAS